MKDMAQTTGLRIYYLEIQHLGIWEHSRIGKVTLTVSPIPKQVERGSFERYLLIHTGSVRVLNK